MPVTTSPRAAASAPVSTPTARGNLGNGRLRSAANSPSAASARLSRSIAGEMVAEPEPLDRRRPGSAARPSPRTARRLPCTCTFSPSPSASSSASKRRRAIVAPRQAPVAGSLSVKKTVAQASLRRSSVTSPSTHTSGRRRSHSRDPAVERGDANTPCARRAALPRPSRRQPTAGHAYVPACYGQGPAAAGVVRQNAAASISAAVAGEQPWRTSSSTLVCRSASLGRELLGDRQREPRLDEDVQAPALDLGLLVLALDVCLCGLGHSVPEAFVIATTFPPRIR